MLPESLRRQLFGPKSSASTGPTPIQTAICQAHLEAQGLWNKPTTTMPYIDGFKLPPLVGGRDLDTHFHRIAQHYYGDIVDQARLLCQKALPPRPSRWLKQAGWTRYADETSKVAFPLEDTLVFDVECLVQAGPYPVMAIAASHRAWYCWVSPVLLNTTMSMDELIREGKFEHLIPMGRSTKSGKHRLIVGHHVGFDRARILEEYCLEPLDLRYLDTMSLHIAVSGMTTNQRMRWKKIEKEMEMGGGDVQQHELEWYQNSALNSLKSVAKFYLGKDVDKSTRDHFVEGSLADIQEHFDELVDYCAHDVAITHEVFCNVFPRFWSKKIQGNYVSLGGILEMGLVTLPISPKWPDYIRRCEVMMADAQTAVASQLRELAEEYLKAPEDDRQTDHYLKQLDWAPASKKRPIPKWYRQLMPTGSNEPEITIRSRVTPLLLRMTWFGYPLYYLGRQAGWCYRVPKERVHEVGKETPIDRQQVMASIRTHIAASKTGKSSEQLYLDLLEQDVDGVFFKLPNLQGSEDQNCGSPLAKAFAAHFSDGKISSEHPLAKAALEANASCSYWISSRDRIMKQFVVWSDKQGNLSPSAHDRAYGIMLPAVIQMGTITRRAVESTWLTASNAKKSRIGSELKSNVIAPEGYTLVGADVDSQELWIASLLGDRQFGIHGGTAFGWMTLQGNKSDGTDLHSRSAKILGASRDHAKIFNYARIYGSGVKFSAQLLARCNPDLSREEAMQRAKDLYAKTKGGHYFPAKRKRSGLPSSFAFLNSSFWHGGSESYMFNSLEKIAMAEDPRTPVLGCQLPESLIPFPTREIVRLF
jgi:DNA polymerase gamma 1